MHTSSKTFLVACLFSFACIALSSTVGVFASVSAAPSFSAPMNISNDTNQAHYPWVANVGSNVFVAWTEESHGIMFRASTDDGSSWGKVQKISPHGGTADYPIVYALGTHVYVVWSQSVLTSGVLVLQIFFAASSNSGGAFSPAIQLTSGTSKNGFITPVIAAAGSNVYVAYTGNGKQSYVVWSNDNGVTWHGPNKYAPDHEPQIAAAGNTAVAIADGVVVYVTNDAGTTWYTGMNSTNNGDEPWVATSATGQYVYVVSQTKTSAGKIHFFYSNNYGKAGSWSPAKEPGVVLSGAVTQGDAWEPQITASGNYLYLTFHELNAPVSNYAMFSSDNGVHWTSPLEINAGKLSGFITQIAISGTDVFAVFPWTVGSSNWDMFVTSNTLGNTGSWTTKDISNNAGTSGPNTDIASSSIAADGSHALVVWQDNTPGPYQVFFVHS
jgi:hypothetical protein